MTQRLKIASWNINSVRARIGLVERLIAEREEARRERNFARADRIRDDLKSRGIALEDSKEGVRWRRVSPTEVH